MIEFKNVQSRFRSKLAWIAISALIMFVIKNYFHLNVDKFDELWNLIMAALVALGVFNNPSDPDKF